MPTILCVSHVAPWPARHGNEIRLQRLLVWLRRRGCRIILVLTASDVGPDRAALVGGHVDRLVLACQSTPWFAPGRWLARCRAWFGAMRFSRHAGTDPGDVQGMRQLADLLYPNGVRRLVRRVAREERIDIHYAYYAFALQAFEHVHRRDSIVCDTVEAFSMARLDPDGVPIDNVLVFPWQDERRMLLACGHILAIQRAEAEYFVGLVPERPVETVGMDYDVAASPGLPSAVDERIGIVGSANQANVDGLRLFLEQIWPSIRQRTPGARLRIGGQLGAAIRQHCAPPQLEGVETVGYVEDIAEFYRHVRIVVNPVRAGTGLKIKTIEALAHCRPIVTYPIGCEGIDPGAERALWVCEHPSAMAVACVTLLQDPARCDAMALAAKEFASTALTADHVYAPLARIIDTITAALPVGMPGVFAGEPDRPAAPA